MVVPAAPSSGAGDVIRVDWIEPELLHDGVPGRLGMTVLPGKHGPSMRYPGTVYHRSLDADLAALRAQGVGCLALLVEDVELERWGDPRIVERAAEQGIRVIRLPIPDGSAPSDPSAARGLLADLRRSRHHTNAAIACMGGVGRTGTIGACALVDGGVSAADAIAAVRRIRHPEAVETSEQEAFVAQYAAMRSPAPPP
jgi:protein-tyrosine phosphatase